MFLAAMHRLYIYLFTVYASMFEPKHFTFATPRGQFQAYVPDEPSP
ncbi:hypothetical protein CACET_c05420 [Clostridium aceticum]|uniref:Uncharacterized protein n=1 Tax=Clostridium aceticum TaxID=84022 RepID=A0A0G3W829_9CLOT|nr:hypothetical protein CACET_c05420 [Clostridium aceticum]